MTDVFTITERSRIMSRVKSTNNRSTELKLISFFNKNAIHGWIRNYNVVGHPDFVFKQERIAIFVDGCFWHGHNCRNTKPDSNREYWERKRLRNIKHDLQITKRFEKRGWTVIRIWECELKKENRSLLTKKLRPLFNSLGHNV